MNKYIFKKIFLLTFLLLTCLYPFSLISEEQANFKLIINEESSQQLHGVVHRQIKGQIDFNGILTNQRINYTAANIKENENLFAITGDNFLNHGYETGNLKAQTFNVNNIYEHQAKVISAVNGDGFSINDPNDSRRGLPRGAYIRDYRTIHEGNHARSLIGIHDDGTVSMGMPVFTGYEVYVLDNAGSRKMHEIKVEAFNRLPEEGEVTAFFSDHDGLIVSPKPKMVFSGIDVKTLARSDRYFAEGKFSHITTEDVEVSYGDFVLMGEAIFAEDLITSEDTILVQNVLGGIHKGIRHGLCGRQDLITNGEIVKSDNTDVHPRTAIGVKEDGTLMFVTVDGRQSHINMDGVDYERLAHLMKYFGAVDSINVDGGDSTTMLFYDEEQNSYEVQNSPSGGPLRSISTAFFFIYGNLEKPLPPSPYPDLRDVLEMPKNIYLDQQQFLTFKEVDEALYYTITVDGKKKYKTSTNSILLDLDYGEHEFEVQAFGDFITHKQSKQNIYHATMFPKRIIDLIEGLKEYGQNANNK